ncbi:MAG: efflux RND transporter periplasmic adaptor subunit [Clostridia bacterium]|nr:efflux RND transporter periplasmic adaptor subunit [Clostridia bacterium]
MAAVAAALLALRMGGTRKSGYEPLLAAAAGLSTVQVSAGPILEQISCIGSIVPVRMAILRFGASGVVRSVNVKEGTPVAEGAVACSLDASRLEYEKLKADNEWRRACLESPPGIIDERLASLRVAEAELAGAAAAAPFTGIAGAIHVSKGEYVSPGQPAITLMDTSSFEVDIEVDEIDIAHVKVGMSADITLDAIPHVEFPGSVHSVGAATRLRGNVVSIPVRVSLEAKHPLLKPGMTAHVRITSGEISGVPRIPNRSWIDVDGEPSVVAVRDGVPRVVRIATGLSDDANTHVITGLSPGDTIIEDAVALQNVLLRTGAKSRSLTFGIERAP